MEDGTPNYHDIQLRAQEIARSQAAWIDWREWAVSVREEFWCRALETFSNIDPYDYPFSDHE